MSLNASIRHFGNVAIVDLEGKITLGENTGILRDNLKSLLSQGTKNIILNMGGVGYVDSAGLGEMAGSYVTVAKLGGQLKLLHCQTRIDTMLQVTKLYALLVAFADESEALRSFDAASF